MREDLFVEVFGNDTVWHVLLALRTIGTGTAYRLSSQIRTDRKCVKKARRGVDVYVLTSLASENKTHQEALAVLAGRSQRMPHRPLSLIAFGLLSLLFSLLHSSWVFMYLGAMFLTLGLVYGLRKLQVPRGHSGLQLRISRAFMHAKIYGADGVIAATGSPNLTFSGLNRNVEHMDIFEGSEASPVINSFHELWNRSSSISIM